MSSFPKKMVTSITESSSVPELIGFLLHSFNDRDYSKVETILINRENAFKSELEKLREAHDLIEKKNGLAELARSRYEVDVEKIRREFDDLKESVKVFDVNKAVKVEHRDGMEENRVLRDDLSESKRKYDELKVTFVRLYENHKALTDKMKDLAVEKLKKEEELCECNRKFDELTERMKVSESEKLGIEEELRECKRKFDELSEKIMEFEEIIKNVKSFKIRDFGQVSSDLKDCSAIKVVPNGSNAKLKDEILKSPYTNGYDSPKEGGSLTESRTESRVTHEAKERLTSESDDDDYTPVWKRKTKRIKDLILNGKKSIPIESRKRISSESEDDDNTPLSKRKRVHKMTENGNGPGPAYIKPCVEVADLEKDRRTKTWKNAGDMRAAFIKDPELCLNAICALYRQEIKAFKSTKTSSSFKREGRGLLDIKSGAEVARYLIDDDPEYKLKKCLSEVEEKHPEKLKICKRLVDYYYEQLFEIYQKKLDPFFCPKL